MVALVKPDELRIIKVESWYFLRFKQYTLTKFQVCKNYYVPGEKYKDLDVLSNFRTQDEFRNMGYGRHLLTEVMKERKFFLASYKDVEDFYRKCGLKEVHTLDYHYTIFENL
jgi:GNAT superfamily N-acetyltransferase